MKKAIEQKSRCGFVTLLGRPNVGKSTLFNTIIGRHISITTPKPQTTRHQILGVKTFDSTQMVFVDTPGLTDNGGVALHRQMNATLKEALKDVEVIIFMVEAQQWTERDEAALALLKQVKCPVLLAINKVDRLQDKSQLLPFIESLNQQYAFSEIIPLSSLNETNLDVLQQSISRLLPESEFYFPEDMVNAASESFLASELVREKLMMALGQELPYAVTVETEQFELKKDVLHVSALIWVEKESHKKIVIGRKGGMLKHIGEKARRSMEALFGQRVYLKLWVKVKRGWSDDQRALKQFGYPSS